MLALVQMPSRHWHTGSVVHPRYCYCHEKMLLYISDESNSENRTGITYLLQLLCVCTLP